MRIDDSVSRQFLYALYPSKKGLVEVVRESRILSLDDCTLAQTLWYP